MKTYQPKAKEVKRYWHLINAKEKVLGRLATEVATYLMGKHKAGYSSHMDVGDYVVIVNAKEIKLTGKKREQKVYRSHSGYPGGFKEISIQKLMKERPERVIEHAVDGMLPDNHLKDKRMRRLKVFVGGDHSYEDKFGSSSK